jgi:hypothetical protein
MIIKTNIAMKNLVFFGLILAVAISATFADVQCYYCGLRKACSDNPFDGINTDKVNCSVGCLKIDGLDSENNPKQVRGCGDLTTTVCEKNKEHFGLTGELCSCTTDLCNGEAGSNAIVIVLVVLLVLAMIVAGALVWYFKDILKNLMFGTSSSQEPKSTAQEPEVPLVPQSTSAKEPESP